jgi:class 3 adenylate cyclase
MRSAAAPAPRPVEPPLIGRANELSVADRWMTLAEEGSPRIGIIRGAPGVGKSRLLRAVMGRAEARGFRVLHGSGVEGASPPLLPMMTALRPLLDQANAGRRPDLSDDDRRLLGLTVPGRSHGRGQADRTTSELVDTARYLAATRLLIGAARAGPVILVIDDAHTIDAASAGLLAHMVAAAAHNAESTTVHLLTVVASRPRAGSTSVRTTIARLSREVGCVELDLVGLDEVGLHEYLLATGDARPSRALVRAIMQRTGGNPLFAHLLYEHLLATGTARVVDGRVTMDDPTGALVARLQLDEVLDLRLDRLSAEALDVLRVAAVVGDGGSLDVLAQVTGRDRAEIDDVLVEAEGTGVCWLEDEHYRFDHPLVVAALTRRFSLAQRRRLHHEIADALAAGDAPSPLDIVAHLRAAGPMADASARRRWGVLAGAEALELGAWGDAAAALDLALDSSDEGMSVERRLELHLDAARAHYHDHDLEGCERHAVAAAELARAKGDLDSWCDAIATMTHAHIRVIRGGEFLATDRLSEFLDEATDAPPRLKARILALLAEIHFAAFEYEQGRDHAEDALRLAGEAGDEELLAFVTFVEGLQQQGRLDLDASDRSFRASTEHAVVAAVATTGEWAKARLASNHWMRLDLDEAEALASVAEHEANRVQDWAELSLIVAWRANIASARARFGDAVRLAERSIALHRRSGYAFSPLVAYPVLVAALSYRGDTAGAHEALADWRASGATRLADQLDVLVDALAGDRAAVEAAIDDGRWRPVSARPPDLGRAAALLNQVEVADSARRPDLIVAVRPRLADLHGRGVHMVPGSPALVSRLCAVAAGAASDWEEATRWLEVARREAGGSGALGEVARCDLTHSRLLALQGHSVEAERCRARAAAAFDELGMLGLLRVAEETVDGGGAGVGSTSVRRARRVILFTDVVGSTTLNVVAGDDEYHLLLRSHDHVVRDVLRAHDGTQFKHTGDGVAAWFSSAPQAVACALDIQEKVAGLIHAASGLSIAVRCGLAAGEPIEDEGDLFGLAVSRAARICDRAGSGEVLVGEEVRAMGADEHVQFGPPTEVELRGLPGTQRVLRAERVALTV